jgi:hypothetical protein
MNRYLGLWKELGIAVLLVVLNGFFVVRMVGLSYTHFNWEAYAQTYDPNGGPDPDGDGIKTPDDPRPNEFDPSGCFYELDDGRIPKGGRVSVSGPGNITELNGLNGSNGCYAFASDMPGTFTITIDRLPLGCGLAASCPDQGLLNATGVEDLGPSPLPNALNPVKLQGLGACTPYFLQVTLDVAGDAVIDNNIAVFCPDVAAPVVSPWGWVATVLLLAGVGLLGLRRQLVPRR